MTDNSVVFLLLQHGSHGSMHDFLTLREVIPNVFKQSNAPELVVFGTDVNSGLKTDKGVVVCGTKLAEEATKELHSVLAKYPDRTVKVCVFGHSMGGLILRHALGLMHEDPVLNSSPQLEWCAFVSSASPHLGCQGLNRVLRAGAYFLGKVWVTSYLDLMLNSPVLMDLCTEKFLCPLRKFKHRVLYANVSDHLVPYQTASLMLEDPKTVIAREPLLSPHVLRPIKLDPPADPMSPEFHQIITDSVPKFFGNHHQHIVEMYKALMSVGRWSVVPVQFTEWYAVSHVAIINHGKVPKFASADGLDVLRHLGETLV
eukprot:PhF_6_TR41621/c0_g1_i2/m.63082